MKLHSIVPLLVASGWAATSVSALAHRANVHSGHLTKRFLPHHGRSLLAARQDDSSSSSSDGDGDDDGSSGFGACQDQCSQLESLGTACVGGSNSTDSDDSASETEALQCTCTDQFFVAFIQCGNCDPSYFNVVLEGGTFQDAVNSAASDCATAGYPVNIDESSIVSGSSNSSSSSSSSFDTGSGSSSGSTSSSEDATSTASTTSSTSSATTKSASPSSTIKASTGNGTSNTGNSQTSDNNSAAGNLYTPSSVGMFAGLVTVGLAVLLC